MRRCMPLGATIAIACAAVLAGSVRATSAGTPAREEAPGGAASSCSSCHAEIAREWAASQHRRAAADPLYEQAVAREPLPFCRRCHAPHADPGQPTTGDARERGIDCVDCHAGTSAGHASAPRTAAPRACASCHEFPFPDGTPGMQRTATEHAKSASAAEACETCHMPRTAGPRPHRDHRFGVDDAILRAALVATIDRVGDGRVALRLGSARVGHAFPTGDLFRRLVITVDARDPDGGVVGRDRRYLARHFGQKVLPSRRIVRVETKDDRIGADLERCFELDLGHRVVAHDLRVEIAYERVDHPDGPADAAARVASRVVLAEKSLPPQTMNTSRSCEPR